MPEAVDPGRLPLRVAERAGRLLFWLMQQEGLTRAERELACWFITDADGDYLDTYKSHGTIAKALGCSGNTVLAAMKGLRAKGLVHNEKRTTPTGQPTTDRNRLLPPPDLAKPRSVVTGSEPDIDVSDYAIGTARFGVPGTRTRTSTTDSGPASTSKFGDEPSSIGDEENLEIEEGSATNSAVPPFELGRRPRGSARSPRSIGDVIGSAGAA